MDLTKIYSITFLKLYNFGTVLKNGLFVSAFADGLFVIPGLKIYK